MGVANSLATPGERRLVLDIGGGSTELILGRGLDIERVESFSVGTVKQSLSFFVGGRIDAGSFEAAILSARSHFEDGAPPYQPQYWRNAYGSSGTIRALAEIIARNSLGDGTPHAGRAGRAQAPLHRLRPGRQDRHAGPAPGPRRHHHRRPGDPDRAGRRTRHRGAAAGRGGPAHGRDVGPVRALDAARPARGIGARAGAKNSTSSRRAASASRRNRRRCTPSSSRPATPTPSCCTGARCCTRWAWWCRRPAITSTPPT